MLEKYRNSCQCHWDDVLWDRSPLETAQGACPPWLARPVPLKMSMSPKSVPLLVGGGSLTLGS